MLATLIIDDMDRRLAARRSQAGVAGSGGSFE